MVGKVKANKTNAKTKINNKAKIKPSVKGFDSTFFIVVVALVLFGLVMVLSASAPSASYLLGNAYHFFSRQLIFALLGFVSMLIIANIDYHILKRFAFPILVISFIMLFLVYVPGIGIESKGARRWIGYGTLSFQPSEVAKLAIIIYFAHSLSNVKGKIKYFFGGLLRYLLILGAFIGVIILEHFSGAVVILLTASSMLLIAGAKLSHFFGLGLLALPLGVIAIVKEPYRLDRITSFLDPFAHALDEGYQIIQSLYAIGSGSIFGLGLGMSRQKYLYIPEPQNDFIFSIISEELGLFGAGIVLLLFIIFVWKGYRIAQEAPDMFGCLLACGITSLVAIQVVINIAVVTSSIPVTGMALPFFSYGGTSLLMLMSSMGIMLNISKQRRVKPLPDVI